MSTASSPEGRTVRSSADERWVATVAGPLGLSLTEHDAVTVQGLVEEIVRDAAVLTDEGLVPRTTPSTPSTPEFDPAWAE